MAEEKKGTPVEKWDEVNGRADDGVMQDISKNIEGRRLGERFIELREATGMSRKEFAGYLNIPYRTMTDWEANKRTMPEYVFALIEYKVVHDLGLDSRVLGSQMRGIEDMVEQNDNQLDGVINNVPADVAKITREDRQSVLEKLKEHQQVPHPQTEETEHKVIRHCPHESRE